MSPLLYQLSYTATWRDLYKTGRHDTRRLLNVSTATAPLFPTHLSSFVALILRFARVGSCLPFI